MVPRVTVARRVGVAAPHREVTRARAPARAEPAPRHVHRRVVKPLPAVEVPPVVLPPAPNELTSLAIAVAVALLVTTAMLAMERVRRRPRA